MEMEVENHKHLFKKLSKKQLEHIKLVFDCYDDECVGEMDLKHLGVALRAAGLILTDKEISETTRKFSQDHNEERIDLGNFFIIFAKAFNDQNEIISNCRKNLDKISFMKEDPLKPTNPQVQVVLLDKLIGSGGELLNDDEEEEFIKLLKQEDCYDDNLDYKKLTKLLFDYDKSAEKR
eukprot:gene9495-12791_t